MANSLTGGADDTEMDPPAGGGVASEDFQFKFSVRCDDPAKDFGFQMWKDTPNGGGSVQLLDWHFLGSCNDCGTG